MSTQIQFEAGTLTLTRVFDAPRELVFDAWTRPELVAQWWGCAQTRHVESDIDLRVGGHFNIVMQGEGYGEMRQTARITDLRVPEFLAYVHDETPETRMPGATGESRISVTFTDVGGRTQVTLTHSGLPDDGFIEKMVSGGWTAAFDKLSAKVSQ